MLWRVPFSVNIKNTKPQYVSKSNLKLRSGFSSIIYSSVWHTSHKCSTCRFKMWYLWCAGRCFCMSYSAVIATLLSASLFGHTQGGNHLMFSIKRKKYSTICALTWFRLNVLWHTLKKEKMWTQPLQSLLSGILPLHSLQCSGFHPVKRHIITMIKISHYSVRKVV